MKYFLVLVSITDHVCSHETHSLCFTKIQDEHEAKKLAVFHIFHLHENNQNTLPSPQEVILDENDFCFIENRLKIQPKILKVVTEEDIHVISKNKLFGYDKGLKAITKVMEKIN